jgi:hypothetical protein
MSVVSGGVIGKGVDGILLEMLGYQLARATRLRGEARAAGQVHCPGEMHMWGHSKTSLVMFTPRTPGSLERDSAGRRC